MKVSEVWLREWVDPDIGIDQLVHLLTMAGLEVDAVEPAAAMFSGVVVGEIVAVEQHPDADKLRVCTVSNGTEKLPVVCGASNVAVGMKVPFAQVGAKLPGDFSIKKAKLRGVESLGMLCGASELGLDDVVDGLLALPADAPLGDSVREYLQLDDRVIDIDLTPNRGDCLSIRGIAREVGVLTQTDVHGPAAEPVAAASDSAPTITLSAPEHCPRYAGRIIEGVDGSAETPLWMREKLRRAGLRSIDPVVDITNYVLLELGQPLHAFDLDKLAGTSIDVRLASKGESLALLDDSDVTLDDDMLVIADAAGAVALAGVMGGRSSAVSTATRNVLLESAFFTPLSQAGKARRLGMHTDASHRFERGVDVALQERAIERATELMLTIVGGVAGPTVIQQAEVFTQQRPQLVLRANQIERVLGFAIPAARVIDMLTRLELQPESIDQGWRVTVPSHRFDIAIEADLLEELARIYGYDNLPVEPPVGRMEFREKEEARLPVSRLRGLLVARGYSEAITYSFIDPELERLFAEGGQAIALANPIASDMSVMRSSLLPGLVSAAQYNLNRQQTRMRLFETGLRFVAGDRGIEQTPMLAGLICGTREPESWCADTNQVVDFYDIKSDVEALLAATSSTVDTVFEPTQHPALHPGQGARVSIAGNHVGHVGLLHPQVAQKLGIASAIWLFELQLTLISEKKVPEFKELSKFPEVRRDLAIVVDSSLSAMEVLTCARRAAGDTLVDIVLFDQYSGAGIEDGKQSIGLGMTWQHPERTLHDDDVQSLADGVLVALEAQYHASLR